MTSKLNIAGETCSGSSFPGLNSTLRFICLDISVRSFKPTANIRKPIQKRKRKRKMDKERGVNEDKGDKSSAIRKLFSSFKRLAGVQIFKFRIAQTTNCLEGSDCKTTSCLQVSTVHRIGSDGNQYHDNRLWD